MDVDVDVVIMEDGRRGEEVMTMSGVMKDGDGAGRGAAQSDHDEVMSCSSYSGSMGDAGQVTARPSLESLPNELLFHTLGFLDVGDLLSTSRVSHHLRTLSLSPLLHRHRLRTNAALLPPLLTSPSRPSLADLIAKSIFLTKTTLISRQLSRSLVSIRLARRLANRPSVEALVQRCVLPEECVPIVSARGEERKKRLVVATGLVAKRREVERERVKDRLRSWVGGWWQGEVGRRREETRRREERDGTGRVWRLRRYWERLGRGEITAAY